MLRTTVPDTIRQRGLTAAEALSRLQADGPNELPRATERPVWRIAAEVVREPMLALLLVGGIAYLLLGSLAEALILLGFASFSIIVTVVQESRTEHVLEALRDLSAPRALVIRDGEHLRVAGREIVTGDMLVLEQGDRIAADAELSEAKELEVDESLLTGESLAVGKGAEMPTPDQVFAGTLVTRGSGIALVVATGPRSAIGRIGQSLASLDSEVPRLRRETVRIVRWCAIGGGAVALLVVLLFGLLRGGWIEAVLAGIAIGMSMLPEEFPVVLTVFLAMGAWRIGKVGVLTRRASAIDTLGSATVLCTDKTGTLTENRMALSAVWLPSGEACDVEPGSAIPGAFDGLIETAAMASAPDPTDPMDLALHRARAARPAIAVVQGALVHTYPLHPNLLAMANIWDEGGALRLAAKGAPEAIAGLCNLTPAALAAVNGAVEAMAVRGIRVLAVATGVPADRNWPETQRDYHYQLAGLVGLADPIRASVPAAVAECRAAGIRVVMITGDHAATARSIAAQAGIADGEVLTGADITSLSDAELATQVNSATVFARIMPDQKLRIVEAFKANGDIVAMTGDGVNDAPSIKAAHIGIAMGKRGTDVAREASAMVLLDDDFGSIVQSVRLGRRIYDNIRKAMAFIFAVHVPIAGLALLPLFFGLPILFGPIHIALLEMVIDPVCALVFEAEREERDIMERPPRDPDESLFSFSMIAWSVFQGGVAFALLGAVYWLKTLAGMPEAELRALMFFALIAQIVSLILVNRSFGASLVQAVARRNSALLYVLVAIAAVTALILYLPQAQALLKFGSISWGDMALAAGLGGALLLLLEGCKLVLRKAIANRVRSADR
ncbi:cation-translocating P-type ATPase [Novosphingobium sp. MMS21-SN21R]|uniref:cation-translocating P-type ATPase n=1 Tax=Novosphingobium sp. MMS21-SN21R TaxID=2969298 RepID=UPI002885998B|nr:cation-translocating P-type ATPase [Novosphingobium sp. MMS21-SN21R]MDT0507913.1 cation-translocating P-type ATPase [Novosphingobium sp. MMS21-SN21R]